LLSVNRSGLYVRKRTESGEENPIKKVLLKLYERFPFMGYRRMTVMLRRVPYRINRKRVYRYMKQLGLQALFPRRNLSRSRQKEMVYPYLLDKRPPEKPNDCWCVDITYIRMPKGYLYLTALVDVVSRKVMGWNIDTSLDTASVLEALSMALKSGHKPKMINSDQGTQFTSGAWLQALKSHGIDISMNGKGRCIDNVPVERFWRSLKYEEVFLKTYDTVREAKQALATYIRWFNSQRPHQSLGYTTPDQAFEQLSNPIKSIKIHENLLPALLLPPFNLTFFNRSMSSINHPNLSFISTV